MYIFPLSPFQQLKMSEIIERYDKPCQGYHLMRNPSKWYALIINSHILKCTRPVCLPDSTVPITSKLLCKTSTFCSCLCHHSVLTPTPPPMTKLGIVQQLYLYRQANNHIFITVFSIYLHTFFFQAEEWEILGEQL